MATIVEMNDKNSCIINTANIVVTSKTSHDSIRIIYPNTMIIDIEYEETVQRDYAYEQLTVAMIESTRKKGE